MRKLTFPTLISYFLNLTKGSYQQELDHFFSVLNEDHSVTQVVTKSALTQARQHLSHTAFIEINRRVVDEYYALSPHLKTWRGYRLCAIDGSQLRLPYEPEIIETFGVNPGKENQKDCPMALASVYYDVLNHISIDASLHPTTASERECAASHLNYAQPNDLSILDRGYNAFWLYALYEAKKQLFCMRAKVNQGLLYKQFVNGGQAQTVITLTPNKSSIKQCQQKGLPITPLRLRLIRVELDNEVEVLITNLMNEQLFPINVFKELYHLRWGVEENYKRLKQWVEIENFSGKSALSIKQDFYAKVLTTNLTAMLVNDAQQQVDKETHHRKYDYQVNFAQALSKMKDTVIELIWLAAAQLQGRIKTLIEYIACSIEPIRGGRSFNRPESKIKNKKHYLCYKRAL